MYFQKDWLMRQIELMAQAIVQLILQKETLEEVVTQPELTAEGDVLRSALQARLLQGAVCAAEDLLFEALEQVPLPPLEVPVWFYLQLNRMSDEALSAANFSREEIRAGLEEVCRCYGVDLSAVMP